MVQEELRRVKSGEGMCAEGGRYCLDGEGRWSKMRCDDVVTSELIRVTFFFFLFSLSNELFGN